MVFILSTSGKSDEKTPMPRGSHRDEVLTSNSASSMQVATLARLEVDSNGTHVTRPHDWDGVADGNTLVVAVGDLKGGASSDDRVC